jgi:preprotein translocase subunit SecB
LRDHKIPPYVNLPASVQVKLDQENSILATEIDFGLYADYEEGHDGGPSSPVSMQAKYLAIFTYTGKIPAAELETFARSVGGTVLWPYWRQFVQYTTQQLGLPPLMVPLLNIPEFIAGVLESTKDVAKERASSKKKVRRPGQPKLRVTRKGGAK